MRLSLNNSKIKKISLDISCNVFIYSFFIYLLYLYISLLQQHFKDFCNNIVVTILLLWSYPSNGTKCDTMAGNSSLLWPWLCDHHMCFQVVCLSIFSVPTLCLKDPQIGNDTIHLKLLIVGVVRWQLEDKKNSLSTINNHLLERIGVTVICPIYL